MPFSCSLWPKLHILTSPASIVPKTDVMKFLLRFVPFTLVAAQNWPACQEQNTVIRNAGQALFTNLQGYGATIGCFLDDCMSSDKFVASEIESCAKVCFSLPECKYWVWGSEEGEQKTGDSGREAGEGWVSGTKACVPPGTSVLPLGNSECWAEGFGYENCCEAKFGPNGNAQCWDGGSRGIRDEEAELKSVGGNGNGGGGLQFDPTALAAAAAKNPKIKEYMQDKDLMQKVSMLSSLSGQMQQTMVMQMVQQDQRVLELFLAMQGLDVSTMRPEDFEQPEPTPAPKKEQPKKEEPKEEDLRSPEQKEADEWKSKGNELYKKKQFKEALEMYDKAIAVVPNDITYHNNKNAVLIEMGVEHYDEVLKSCQDLLDRRYEINSANPGGASFEKVAKVFQRMASVYEKLHKYDDAIAMYNKALTEDNNRSVRNALRDCERAKEKHEKDAYLDPEKGEEHREKGNEFFKETTGGKCGALVRRKDGNLGLVQ
eukprot:s1023_g7.t1